MPSKSTGGGPKAALNRQELESLEADEVPNYKKVNSSIIDDVVTEVWFKVYHAVVLLAAATDPPNIHPVNEAGNQFDKPNSHIVPAFGDREGPDGQSTGWIFKDIGKTFTHIEDNPTLGLDFPDNVIQQITIELPIGIGLGNGTAPQSQPIIKYYLDSVDPVHLPPPTTDAEAIITPCRNSTGQMQFHDDTGLYVGLALDIIEELLQQATPNYGTIQGWLAENPPPEIGSEAWLKNKLGIDDLLTLGGQKYPLLTTAKKQEIGQWSQLLDLNRTTFGLTFNRLADRDDDSDKSDGLEEVIKKLTVRLSGPNKAAWQTLYSVMVTAIAWIIFDQAKDAVDNVRNIFEEV